MKNGYSICFNEWALDKSINGELGLLLIISSLCAEKGYCFASNEYFANLFDEHETTISRKIKKLSEKKYITVEYEKKGAEIKNRTIRLANLLTDGYQNCYSTISEIAKDNNISSINNIRKNNNISNDILLQESREIIDYLNEKTGKHFQLRSSSTISHIKARIKEGFTVEDFKKVIDNKVVTWGDNEMEKFLRPQTLFGSKFESYLNEKNIKQPKKETLDELNARILRELEEGK